ncbi:GNAT family N-acetyltransferase [Rhodococcus sp. BP-349]|uniref:GNAT family N-acetyltransferase n=1 Tax=unclassified Rhodococcus (in: high G+C Gram-positive bacteria) TaxID=192944 RepID=UPI001C9BB996|nr:MULTISPECIES: GNAT family N-acetyltransferase [unclassified Rhodococcus (in: high G+C Gram-positive bacteria)]MBY6539324.1 GNAT family N-acetyltransferase [Rhodococcus sp. BP-363]MBY6544348.1 GNAT family N-acetyltransferase [Rhodococcus sp. BP-369]MBY6563578.1 GNAT family N-acetyltransferase [Rhodococcus sp. BP-370]MBY6577870.1 GNAT family N-acetyltransferase [Rhodococcus sp. BP-364]MBY6587171.1 GNAT family N-acetyltransferase [Rhodococcus sp. BP-358]
MELELRTHHARSTSLADEPAAATWIRAVTFGFHEPTYTDEALALWLRTVVAMSVRMRGVHDLDTAGLRDPDQPVGTLGSWDTTVNIGGSLLPANAISDVTTRASHRRRGILRRLMTADLTDAADRGLPLAALTVSESGIYRRFGFGPAVQANAVKVRTDASFGITSTITGRVELVDRDVYLEHVEALFAVFHSRTSGSVARHPSGSDALSGTDLQTGKLQHTFRYALHLDDDGQCDGAVAWKIEDDNALVIRDLIVPDPAVGIMLWDFLGRHDLVTTVTQRRARVDDALRTARTGCLHGGRP